MRLIDKDAAIKAIQHYDPAMTYMIEYVEEITPESLVKRGRWVDNHCSVCGMMPMGEDLWRFLVDIDPPKFEYFMRYCPSCGAKMVED